MLIKCEFGINSDIDHTYQHTGQYTVCWANYFLINIFERALLDNLAHLLTF